MSDRKLPPKQYVRSCPYCPVVFITTSSARISCGSVECDKAARAGRNWRYREGYCDGAPDPKLAQKRRVKASKHSRDYRERKKRKGRGLPIEPPNDEAFRKPPVREHGENELDANAA